MTFVTAMAGESLIITGQKTLVRPGQNKIDAEQERLRAMTQFKDAPMPYSHMPVQPLPRWRARAERTKEEKRKDLQRAEKENWALLAPGELQDAEGNEYDFGVRDYEGDDGEENARDRDYTFYGLDKSQTDPSDKAGRSRSEVAQQESLRDAKAMRRIRREQADRAEDTRSSDHLNPFRVSTDNPAGTGLRNSLANDIQLNAAFNSPVAGDASGFGGSGLAGGQLLGAGPGLNQANRDQAQRMESFRSLIGVNSGLNSPLGNASSLINQSPDFTRQSVNPSIGALGNNRAFNQRLNQQPAFGPPRVSGFSSLPSLDLRQPRPTGPNLLSQPSTSFDTPRPKF